MIKFNLRFGHNGQPSGYNPVTADEAYESVPRFTDEMALRDLDLGESYIDGDGDTWERVE